MRLCVGKALNSFVSSEILYVGLRTTDLQTRL